VSDRRCGIRARTIQHEADGRLRAAGEVNGAQRIERSQPVDESDRRGLPSAAPRLDVLDHQAWYVKRYRPAKGEVMGIVARTFYGCAMATTAPADRRR